MVLQCMLLKLTEIEDEGEEETAAYYHLLSLLGLEERKATWLTGLRRPSTDSNWQDLSDLPSFPISTCGWNN